mgnify:CR=1 FL=1
MIEIGSSWNSFERVKETIRNMDYLCSLNYNDNVEFNFCEFARPISIVPISVLGFSKNLNFEGYPAYLENIGFPYGQEVSGYIREGARHIPLTRADLTGLSFLEREEKLRNLSDFYNSLLNRNIITDEEFLDLVGNNVSALLITEMVDNITEHSSAENSFIFSQYWERTDSCEICLADDGIGMYQSLIDAERDVESDLDAIKQIIEDCLSAKDEFGSIKRGTGIRNAINLLSNNELKGYFCVISGSAGYYIDNTGIDGFLNLENLNWNGTIINMGFTKPDNKLDIYEFIR